MSREKKKKKKRKAELKKGAELKARKKGKNLRILILLAIIFLGIAAIFFGQNQEAGRWTLTNEGLLLYPGERGQIKYTIVKNETSNNDTLETLTYLSKDSQIGGLLRLPPRKGKVPGIILLPGATVPKEGVQGLARDLADMGYATLAIDQRNLGGVDFQREYSLFLEGKEPEEYKMVYDALLAAEVLRKQPKIDPDRIAFLGESNGGRFAIIATALDPKIRGVIGISTSGYDIEGAAKEIRDPNLIKFYKSIDPDSYLQKIPPRKLVLVHGENDTIIPILQARNTYTKAKEPKKLYTINTSIHGYSEEMKLYIQEELNNFFR